MSRHIKAHFFNVAGQLEYTDVHGNTQTRIMNAIVESPIKQTSSSALNEATRAMMSQLRAQKGILPSNITGFALLGTSWLGLMTRDEFYDLGSQANSDIAVN